MADQPDLTAVPVAGARPDTYEIQGRTVTLPMHLSLIHI